MKRTRWTTVITLLLVVTAGSLATRGTAAPIGQRQARAASLSGSNLLANPDFATLGPSGSPTSFTGNGFAGDSAAAQWSLFNNGTATITTELVDVAGPSGTPSLIRVATTGQHSGLVQVFGPFNTGPQSTSAAAWVYVVHGQVGIGTGNGGNTSRDVLSTTTGTWELLQSPNGVAPANEFIIYSESEGAIFYVDYAEVVAVAGS